MSMLLTYLSVTTPSGGQQNNAISRSNLLSLFLTTVYYQDIKSGREQVILLVVPRVVKGSSWV